MQSHAWISNAKWKKPGSKSNVLEVPGKGKTTGTEEQAAAAGNWRSGEELDTKEHEGIGEVMKLFYILISMFYKIVCICQNSELNTHTGKFYGILIIPHTK